MGHPKDCPERLRGRATIGEEMLRESSRHLGVGSQLFLEWETSVQTCGLYQSVSASPSQPSIRCRQLGACIT